MWSNGSRALLTCRSGIKSFQTSECESRIVGRSPCYSFLSLADGHSSSFYNINWIKIFPDPGFFFFFFCTWQPLSPKRSVTAIADTSHRSESSLHTDQHSQYQQQTGGDSPTYSRHSPYNPLTPRICFGGEPRRKVLYLSELEARANHTQPQLQMDR